MAIDQRFSEGSILYFSPFIFPDGGEPKPKYFLVLKHTEGTLLLASLPTSKDSIPTSLHKQHGCIDDININFNCYYFEPDVVICQNGFSFPLETYVYGFRLKEFDSDIFNQQEKTGQTIIIEEGILTNEEYKAVINCLSASKSVKRAYRRLLEA